MLSLNNLYTSEEDGFGLACESGDHIHAEVCGHVDCVQVQRAAVQPEIFGALGFFVWVK